MSRLASLKDIVEPIRRQAFINLTKDTMQHQGKSTQDQQSWSYENSMKNWRSWGSWFSWGSPIGLGLFFISIATTLWILSQAFGWK